MKRIRCNRGWEDSFLCLHSFPLGWGQKKLLFAFQIVLSILVLHTGCCLEATLLDFTPVTYCLQAIGFCIPHYFYPTTLVMRGNSLQWILGIQKIHEGVLTVKECAVSKELWLCYHHSLLFFSISLLGLVFIIFFFKPILSTKIDLHCYILCILL